MNRRNFIASLVGFVAGTVAALRGWFWKPPAQWSYGWLYTAQQFYGARFELVWAGITSDVKWSELQVGDVFRRALTWEEFMAERPVHYADRCGDACHHHSYRVLERYTVLDAIRVEPVQDGIFFLDELHPDPPDPSLYDPNYGTVYAEPERWFRGLDATLTDHYKNFYRSPGVPERIQPVTLTFNAAEPRTFRYPIEHSVPWRERYTVMYPNGRVRRIEAFAPLNS